LSEVFVALPNNFETHMYLLTFLSFSLHHKFKHRVSRLPIHFFVVSRVITMGSCMSSKSGDGGVAVERKKSKTKAFQGAVSDCDMYCADNAIGIVML
jgi:hypothetical protein